MPNYTRCEKVRWLSGQFGSSRCTRGAMPGDTFCKICRAGQVRGEAARRANDERRATDLKASFKATDNNKTRAAAYQALIDAAIGMLKAHDAVLWQRGPMTAAGDALRAALAQAEEARKS